MSILLLLMIGKLCRARDLIDDSDIQDTVIARPENFIPETIITNFDEPEKKEPPEMTKAEIKVELDALGIDYTEKDNKEVLFNKLINL